MKRRTAVRALTRFAFGSMIVTLLAGCSVVDRTALRLNSDGTLDFGSCEGALDASSITVYLTPTDDASADREWTAVDSLPHGLNSGDVISLGEMPGDDGWEYIGVAVRDTQDETIVSGSYQTSDLEVGEWAWAQSGIFVGTVDVDHCDFTNDGPS